ncbi:MAG: hypothetical protein J4473_03165 [Candidatus Aenigmarchaeota archaeon]|nr:hypothetical protein [Candidatus Aenigmarchaeota archaeon]
MDNLDRLCSLADLAKEDILGKLEEKKTEFPGVSENGLITLVAKDLGIDLNRPPAQELKINSILPNMRNICFVGKVTDVSPIHEFITDRGPGRVMNITLEDETGSIRISLWNDEIDKYMIANGDVIKIDNCITRKDNLERPEARLGFNGKIEKTDIPIKLKSPKHSLEDAKEGDRIETDLRIIEIFDRPLVYSFCPECRARLSGNVCNVHGMVQPDKALILSGIVDDGTKSINTVFFRDVAERVLGKGMQEIEAILKTMSSSDYISGEHLIEKKFKVGGAITKNRMTGEDELRIKTIELAG